MKYYGVINLWLDAADEGQADEIQENCRNAVLEVAGVTDAFDDGEPEVDELEAIEAMGQGYEFSEDT